MRAVVDGVEIEGTAAEIAELLATLRDRDSAQRTTIGIGFEGREIEDPEDEEITAQFAYRTLKRLPLSQYQRALLFKLKQAYPAWTLASEIAGEFDWSGTQLGGVLGGLGRRLTATKGYKPGYELWNWKWEDDEGEYTYRLPEAVISALDRLE